ncbi:hypothetical protein K437DRAFT_254367 [Tilletiaria anomala UBC 951]|uniref:Sm domain-containing protein n=1 Tax=Tilletiaria anomala (strain ATCC 24038 / CBS 436.72 / UBC 951) TaxID=1037660 RepID=A0A066WP56_TILAU|nr:uncharacterized protein K437DRAFT_254367 [Tilletiaria anomala UBC 951]KDN52380.1 hypothetical protein K437DRAFT_254367 [Tilletiaria anomala UBC 951]
MSIAAGQSASSSSMSVVDVGPAIPKPSAAAKLNEYEIRTTLLDKTCLVHITDGRAFKGNFVCVDSARNVLLNNATEYKLRSPPGQAHGTNATKGTRPPRSLERQIEEFDRRFVGLVMVPGGHILKLEVQAGMPPVVARSSGNNSLRPLPSDGSIYI